MSDENGEAGAEDTAGELEISGDDLADIADPALARRLETIHQSMSTLGTRIDALVTSTTSYRAALTDRLNEYAELVTKQTRSQAGELEEHRRANERVIAELRQGLATSEEALQRIADRVDALLGDAETGDDAARRTLTEVRSILDAQEDLGRFLTESLDRFGEQVLGRIQESEQRAEDRLEAIEQALDTVRSSVGDPGSVRTDDLDHRLAGMEDRLAVLANADPASALAGRFDTLHAAIQDLTSDLVAGDLGAGSSGSGVGESLDRVEREVEATGKVTSETWSELAGLKAKVDAILETTANETGSVSGVLEELKLTLQDLASGEVVGSLWEEFRHLRATVETLVEHTGTTADPEAVEALRTDVVGLTESVRTLLDQAEVADGDEPGAAAGPRAGDAVLDELAAEVRSLRRELADGLVVEASDDLGSSVEQLRSEVAGMGERLAAVAELRDRAAETPAPVAEAGPATVDTSALDRELHAVRSGVEDILARLDEGLDLELDASELVAPGGPAESTGTAGAEEVSALADQVATLRDLVSTEFEAIRQQLGGADADGTATGSVDLDALTARLDRLHDDIADQQALAEEIAAVRDAGAGEPGEGEAGARDQDGGAVDLTPVHEALAELQEAMAHLLDREAPPAAAPATGSEAGEFATLDPDSLDLLREEIRASATPTAELIDTLNTELKALRRRIRLRVEDEVLSDEQLELIAEAVARRLGGTGDRE